MSGFGNEFSDLNVFQMIAENGGPGIWIRRTTWGDTCARVVAVGELTAPPPYFGNPSVLMDVYSLSGDLRDELVPVPVPGTFKTWRSIDPPEWASTIELRALDDPSIAPAIEALDRTRGKGKATSVSKRIYLNVPFSEKEEAKFLGAKWDRNTKRWWLPSATDDKTIERAMSHGWLAKS